MPNKPKLGQNFLVDDQARQHIADAVGDVRERTVVEIGPGHGAITDLLATRARHLFAVELDRALAAELRFRYRENAGVTIIEQDVLQTDLSALIAPGETLDVVGNLPYYITSDILLRLFAAARDGHVKRAVLMMQREVAQRVTAAPGVRDYGLLSATTRMHGSADLLFTLPPAAFDPPPDVFSSVVRFEFNPVFAELGVEAVSFDRFLHQVFAQKRKTLRNNLRSAAFAQSAIDRAWPVGLNELVRAEDVPIEVLASLYRGLERERSAA